MNAPRWSPAEPTAKEIDDFLAEQQRTEIRYRDRGASRDGAPAGYTLDHNCVSIGRGEADFAAACQALRDWRMFPRPWTRIAPAGTPIREGQTVAMLAHSFGWWLNACRIIYVFDETKPVRRFGFAYGTLEAHVEEGEERFMVELREDGSVWYDLRAFSRPRYWLVRMAKPLARRQQRRFVRDSQRAMGAAVAEARGTA